MNHAPNLRLRPPSALALAALAPLLLGGCDLIKQAQATTIVAGLLVATPEVKLAGHFDVPSETVASAYVGERSSPTSTAEPKGIAGATVTVALGSGAVRLADQMSRAGFYLTTSVDDPALTYVDGGKYVFSAKLPGDTVAFGGSVVAPTKLSDASVTYAPAPTAIPMVSGIAAHPKSTDLTLTWQAQNGRYAYVTVLRADAAHPDQPQVVFDNRPQSASELLQFVAGAPATSITIPGMVFAEDAGYAVILVTLDRGDADANTFLGSPMLAGSGSARILAVGSFRP